MMLKKTLLPMVVAMLMLGNTEFAVAASLTDLEDSVVVAEEAISDLQKEQEYAMDVSGYADSEFIYKDNGEPMGFRMHHLSLFFQKKISQKWRFFSEVEFEDALKHEFEEGVVSEGEVWGNLFVEAVNFDYQWRPEATVRIGRFFTPAGIWSVDHYPPFVTTQERPGHIRKIFPQLTDGAMLYGTLRMGASFIGYDAYLSNGEGNTGAGDKNDAKSLGFKANISFPIPGLKQFDIGGTAYVDPADSENNDQAKLAVGAHTKIRFHDFILQAEGATAHFSADSGAANPDRMGYYAQLTYTPNDFSIGARYDVYDSDTSIDGATVTNTVYINYRATANLVLKLEHHFIDESGVAQQKTIASIAAYLD